MGSDKGGLLVGKTDTNGGKGIIVQAPEGEIRMGGNEIIINAQAAKENCETLSQINQSTGGVAIPCDVKGNTDDHPATAEEVRKRAKMVDGGHVSKGKKNESVITKKTIEDLQLMIKELRDDIRGLKIRIDDLEKSIAELMNQVTLNYNKLLICNTLLKSY